MNSKPKNGKPKSDIMILREYFGLLPSQMLVDFKAEVDRLSLREKKELVDLARAELA